MKVAPPVVRVDRFTRARVRKRMARAGYHSVDNRYADVYVAALKAGLSDEQAYRMAKICHAWVEANGLYVPAVETGANGQHA